jgi:hypothetical protein
MSKRKPAFGALLIIGLGLLPIAISGNTAFGGVAAAFFVIGAAGLVNERRRKDGERGRTKH